MANVKFYRGLKAKYSYSVDGGTASGTHVDGLYYATDTHEIFMNGVSYGNVKDLRLQKRSGSAEPYTWADASTLYWGGHYRFATSDGNAVAFEFDTPTAKSGGYLKVDSNGTNLEIDSTKIADGDAGTTGHDKLATKGYVDDLSTALAGALLSVAGNAKSDPSGDVYDVLSLTKDANSQIYSGDLTFTKEGSDDPQTITVQFDAANFVKDSYLTGVTYYQTEPTGQGAPVVPSGTVFPALYFKFETSGGASNFWVSVANLFDDYNGSASIDITNHVINAKVTANGGLQIVANSSANANDGGLAVKTADTSLTTSSAGLAVKTATKKGLETVANTSGQTDGGLAVKLETDGGIAFDSTNGGLEIKPKSNSGIEVTSDGVAVKTGAGLQTDSTGVSVKLHETSSTNDSGLTATSADGLIVNTGGTYVTKSSNNIDLATAKIEGYNASATDQTDNNLASKKYVDSQLTAGLIWNEVS